MPPRGLPTLVVLPPVASSSVAPLSSERERFLAIPNKSNTYASFGAWSPVHVALLCLILQRHRRLSVPCSRGFSCLSAQFCSPRCVPAYCGPSSLSSSPLARTTLLTPTPIICQPVMLLLRSTLSFFDHLYLYRRRRHWGSLRVCRNS